MSKLRDAFTSRSKHPELPDAPPEVETEQVIALADAVDRERICVRGALRTVTMRPRGGVPAIEAELFDGTDAVTVIWLGRRDIKGIAPGISLEVQGRIGRYDGVRTIFNPRYELIP